MKRWMTPAHGIAAQQQRFVLAARVQQPSVKDMAAFGIGAKLNLVDHQGSHRIIQRHRFHGADIENAAIRTNLFPRR